MKLQEVAVVIVGAGPSGLAASACLNLHSVPNIVLEREDCSASLWKKRTYDRVNLHLAKQFCHLPHMPHPPSAPTFISKTEFVRYLDDYVSKFHISPKYCRAVNSAMYDDLTGKWLVNCQNTVTGENEEYVARFLVVATGENCVGVIPDIKGLGSFKGSFCHSSQYKSGSEYRGKKVLVVGCGNSGMEIAFDLCNHGATTSIVVRSPFHVLTRELVHLGMRLLNDLPVGVVDPIVSFLAKLKYGNLTKYGIQKPRDGPFLSKQKTGRSPVLDVGTINQIKSGDIEVLPAILEIKDSQIKFQNGLLEHFDDIIFATGYKSNINSWLQDAEDLINKYGMPKPPFPNHWKGEKGLYCAGLARRGLAGVTMDAKSIADDISKIYNDKQKDHQA